MLLNWWYLLDLDYCESKSKGFWIDPSLHQRNFYIWENSTFLLFQCWQRFYSTPCGLGIHRSYGRFMMDFYFQCRLNCLLLNPSQKLQAINYCCLVVSGSISCEVKVWYLGFLLLYLNQASYMCLRCIIISSFTNWILTFIFLLQGSYFAEEGFIFSKCTYSHRVIFDKLNMMLGEFCMTLVIMIYSTDKFCHDISWILFHFINFNSICRILMYLKNNMNNLVHKTSFN